jgi:hypothetical protein
VGGWGGMGGGEGEVDLRVLSGNAREQVTEIFEADGSFFTVRIPLRKGLLEL